MNLNSFNEVQICLNRFNVWIRSVSKVFKEKNREGK